MSDRKDQNQDFSVDDILAEYGTGKYKREPSKVVEFPQREEPFNEEPPVITPRPRKKEAPVEEIVPQSVGRSLAARLSTLLRRADHYADHMYDQAEPDEETRKKEKYIPGVDKEEVPEEPVRPRRPIPPPVVTPPQNTPGHRATPYP